MAKSISKDKIFLAMKVLSVATLLGIGLYGVISPAVVFLSVASITLTGPAFLLILVAAILLHELLSWWWSRNWHNWVTSKDTAKQISQAWKLFGILLAIVGAGFALHHWILLSGVVGTSTLFLGGPALVFVAAIMWVLYLISFQSQVFIPEKVNAAPTAAQTPRAKIKQPAANRAATRLGSRAALRAESRKPRATSSDAKRSKGAAVGAPTSKSQKPRSVEVSVPVGREEKLQSAELAKNFLDAVLVSAQALPMRRQKTLTTENDGDCAIHAVLGVESKSGVIYCSDAVQKRGQMRAAIRESKEGDAINKLGIEGIKELLMSGRSVGDRTQYLLLQYQDHLNQQRKLNCHLWNNFEATLRQFPEIIQHINKIHQLPNDPPADLYHKLYDALNRNDGELYGMILSLPELDAAFKLYNRLQNIEWDWDHKLQPAIGEYAAFVGKKGQWLLPSEVALVAHVFNKRVIFYPAPRDDAKSIIYNEGARDQVAVQFDGRGHYERAVLVPVATAAEVERSSAVSFPAAASAFKL